MIFALFITTAFLSSLFISSMEIPESQPSGTFTPTESELAIAAWTYSISLTSKKPHKLSDSDIHGMIAFACKTAKISVYDGIADDLVKKKCVSWSDLIAATQSPQEFFIPQKKPYAIAQETGTAVIDSGSTGVPLVTALGLGDIYDTKKKHALSGDYWIWDKATQPEISPNGKFFAGLCYSEKEYRIVDLTSDKATLIPRTALLGMCITNSSLFAVTSNGLYEHSLPLSQSPSFSGKPLYVYTKSVSKPPDQPIIRASSDGTALIVLSSVKMVWLHRKIKDIFLTEEISLQNFASWYSFIPVSSDCIIGINRNAWCNATNQHLIGYRPECQPYDQDGITIRPFTRTSMGSGVVSPDGNILALELPGNDIGIFSLQKDRIPSLYCTLKNVGTTLCWANTLGQPIICYGSKKGKKKNEGVVLIYPSGNCYTLARYKAITSRTTN